MTMKHPGGKIEVEHYNNTQIKISNLLHGTCYFKSIYDSNIWTNRDRRLRGTEILYECYNQILVDWKKESINENFIKMNKGIITKETLRLNSEMLNLCPHPIVNIWINFFNHIGIPILEISDNYFTSPAPDDQYVLCFGNCRKKGIIIRLEVQITENGCIGRNQSNYFYLHDKRITTNQHRQYNSLFPKIDLSYDTESINVPGLLYNTQYKIGKYKHEMIDLNWDVCEINDKKYLSVYVMNVDKPFQLNHSLFTTNDGNWRAKYVYNPITKEILKDTETYKYEECKFITVEDWSPLYDTYVEEQKNKLNSAIRFYTNITTRNKELILSGASVNELELGYDTIINDMAKILSQINASNFTTGKLQNYFRLYVNKQLKSNMIQEGYVCLNISFARLDTVIIDKDYVLLCLPISSCDVRGTIVDECYKKCDFLDPKLVRKTYLLVKFEDIPKLLDVTKEFYSSIGVDSNAKVIENLKAIDLYRELYCKDDI